MNVLQDTTHVELKQMMVYQVSQHFRMTDCKEVAEKGVQVDDSELNELSLQCDDNKVNFYTGLPNYATLKLVFELIIFIILCM